MVIDAEMFGDASNRNPSLVHLRRLGRDRLLDRLLGRSPKLNYNRDLSKGSQPLRSRPPLPLYEECFRCASIVQGKGNVISITKISSGDRAD